MSWWDWQTCPSPPGHLFCFGKDGVGKLVLAESYDLANAMFCLPATLQPIDYDAPQRRGGAEPIMTAALARRTRLNTLQGATLCSPLRRGLADALEACYGAEVCSSYATQQPAWLLDLKAKYGIAGLKYT